MKRQIRMRLLLVLALVLGPVTAQARYLNPNTGRFQTMDSYEGNRNEPLSLHKYLYTHANPVNRTDPTGKWATFIHKTAIKNLLSFLSEEDIATLCKMQDEVDAPQNQKAKDSYMHAMRDGETKETPEHAKQSANERIRNLLTEARELEAKGERDEAMKRLGRAMHTLQDSTSPAHHGFQPWYDYPGDVKNPHEWVHGSKESDYPRFPSWLATATLRSYNYFKGTDLMPDDFFADLGADGVVDRVKERIRPYKDPSINDIWIFNSIGGGFGVAF